MKERLLDAWLRAREGFLAFVATKRLGLLDLLLALFVIVPVVTRTPVGAVGAHALGLVWDDAPEPPALTSYFQTGPPEEITDWALDLLPNLDELESDLDPGQLPALYRIAATRAFKKYPPATKAQLEAYADVPEDERLLALLDDLYTGDAEEALELAVLGQDARDRAIARATAAGFDDPHRLEVHRPFLAGADGRRADEYVAGVLAVASVLDLEWPVRAPYRITSVFGPRFHPVWKKDMAHNGVDIGIPEDTPLYAAQSGEVLRMGFSERSGNYMVLGHGHGVETLYCHMNRFQLKKGDKVKRGQRIGDSGNTGRTTGPHLHYGTKVGGKSMDPLKLHRKSAEAKS